MTDIYHRRTTCRSCGGSRLYRFLELGPTPLANAFLDSEDRFADERSYPLDAFLCETCGLVQLLDVVDPEVLFRDYVYVTGTSPTMTRHFAAYARTVIERLELGAGDLVLEAASNDGSLLEHFVRAGVDALGVEPARNIAAIARSRGVDTVEEFFGPETARSIRSRRGAAKAVLGNNVLAHVDDTTGFLRGMRELLAPGGRAIVEVPYLGEMLEGLEYDTIYHEHLCYFSVTALMRLFETAGMRIERVDRVPVHGGSLRVWGAAEEELGEHDASVQVLSAREREEGLTDRERYDRFALDVAENRLALRALLEDARGRGLRVAGYGAPAKGNTLLNYCGIGPDLLAFTVDRNPLKSGRFTPGMHIPVREPSAIERERPDVLLILAWNYAEEIVEQESGFRARGGRFLVPIPHPGELAA